MGDNDVQSCPTPPRAPEHGGGAAAEEDAAALRLLDSLDGYLILLDSLSSALRQGWFELASARHSMGSSRISSALFDLKAQSAATTLQVIQLSEGSPLVQFITGAGACRGRQGVGKGRAARCDARTRGRRAGGRCDTRTPALGALGVEGAGRWSSRALGAGRRGRWALAGDDLREVQRERSKSLAVFGTLVSPKLRASQISFEKALETIVEIANLRSMALSAYSQLLQLEK